MLPWLRCRNNDLKQSGPPGWGIRGQVLRIAQSLPKAKRLPQRPPRIPFMGMAFFKWLGRLWNQGSRSASGDVSSQEPPEASHSTDKHLALIDSRTIPSTPQNAPVLTYLSESATYYAKLLLRSAVIFKDVPRPGPRLSNDEISMHNNRFVMSQWGLIARGKEAVPFAVDMLHSEITEVREAAAGVLGAVGRDEEVVSHVLQALEAEYHRPVSKQTILTLDTLVGALGRMKNKQAIPILATLLRDTALNYDSRFAVAEALGNLARKRFEKRPDPIAAATEWLDSKGL